MYRTQHYQNRYPLANFCSNILRLEFLRVWLCKWCYDLRYFFSLLVSGVCGKKAPGSFLFSLVNPSGLPPTKMPLISGREGKAICCDSSTGPTFGSGSGHDLCISNAPNSNGCSVNLNKAYRCPTGQNANTFLTGNQSFTVSEMEVFGFDK